MVTAVLIAVISVFMISCNNGTKEVPTCTVTIVKEDGTELGSSKVEKGGKYTLPETFSSIEDGYMIVSYSYGTDTYKPKEEITVNDDIKLTAKISEVFTVSIKKNDGTELGSAEVIKGEKYMLPETFSSIEKGYKLVSYTDGTNTYNPKAEITVNADIELTATISQVFTVTFMESGRVHCTVEVLAGEKVDFNSVTELITDDSSEFEFDYWKIQGTETRFDQNSTVSSTLTVEAVYKRKAGLDED